MQPGWESRKRRPRFILPVRKYVRLFLSSGKSIEQFLSLSNEQLHEMFGCTESRHRDSSSRQIELKALLPGYVSRLTQKGTSVRKLFKLCHSAYRARQRA